MRGKFQSLNAVKHKINELPGVILGCCRWCKGFGRQVLMTGQMDIVGVESKRVRNNMENQITFGGVIISSNENMFPWLISVVDFS